MEKERTQVLKNNMKKGFIDTAPIHNDVCTLNKREMSKLTSHENIDLVCGGFPCTGFSSAGLLQGFKNEASFLFFEMRRIIEEVSPRFIFLENVPGVRTSLHAIVDSLSPLGYTLVWLTVSAEVRSFLQEYLCYVIVGFSLGIKK